MVFVIKDYSAMLVLFHKSASDMKERDMQGDCTAQATRLFKDGELSLSRAAKLADMALTLFIAHISRLGIPVISQSDEEVESDMDTLDNFSNHAIDIRASNEQH